MEMDSFLDPVWYFEELYLLRPQKAKLEVSTWTPDIFFKRIQNSTQSSHFIKYNMLYKNDMYVYFTLVKRGLGKTLGRMLDIKYCWRCPMKQ